MEKNRESEKWIQSFKKRRDWGIPLPYLTSPTRCWREIIDFPSHSPLAPDRTWICMDRQSQTRTPHTWHTHKVQKVICKIISNKKELKVHFQVEFNTIQSPKMSHVSWKKNIIFRIWKKIGQRKGLCKHDMRDALLNGSVREKVW